MATLWGSNIQRLLAATKDGDGKPLSQRALATEIGVSAATVSGWFSGDIKAIDGENLVRVARFFNIHPQRILHEELTGAELVLVAAEGESDKGFTLYPVPVIGVLQSTARDKHEIREGAANVALRALFPSSNPLTKALRIAGDGLRPRFKPGESIIVDPGPTPQPGHEVLVRTRDGLTMVVVLDWRRDGVTQFSGVNEDIRPITVADSDIEAMHRIVGTVQPDMHVYPPAAK